MMKWLKGKRMTQKGKAALSLLLLVCLFSALFHNALAAGKTGGAGQAGASATTAAGKKAGTGSAATTAAGTTASTSSGKKTGTGSAATTAAGTTASGSKNGTAASSSSSGTTAAGGYKMTKFYSSGFHEEEASKDGEVVVDQGSVAKGYIGFSAVSANKLKVQMIKDETTYTYDVANDGKPSIYPLQMGDGSYYYRVLENVSGTKYSILSEGNVEVKLNDEFQPFLRPNALINYNDKSECVKKAAELASQADTALGVVNEIFDYIVENVSYDAEKAKTVQSGYLPDPDETLSSGKGICFDYAALASAMMRSQGIPAKMVFGYVSPDDLYHAWNMFYTEETGWMTVEYQVDKNTWNRLDLTFSSGGASTEFVGNGGNYADVYYY